MKKLFIILLLGLFMLSFASATIKDYDDETDIAYFYEGNIFKGELFADVEFLTSKHVTVGYGSIQTVYEYIVTSYTNSDDLDDIFDDFDDEYYDLNEDWKEINKTLELEYKTYALANRTNYTMVCDEVTGSDCTMIVLGYYDEMIEVWNELDEKNVNVLKGQTMHIRGRTYVEKGDYIEVIPTMFGKRLPERSSWDSSLSVGLKSWFVMNDSGVNLTDIISGVDAVGTGIDYQQAGMIEYSIYCGGGNDMVDTYSQSITALPFSIQFWTKRDGTQTAYSHIVQQRDGTAWNYAFQPHSDYTMKFLAGGGINIASSTVIPDGQWVHILGQVYANGTAELWFNGTKEANAGGGSWAGRTTNDIICRQNATGVSYKGYVDEVGISNRTYSQSEISDIINGGIPINPLNVTAEGLSINITLPLNTTYNTNTIGINWTNSSYYNASYYDVNGTNQTLTQNLTSMGGLSQGQNDLIIWARDNSTGDWASDNVTFNIDSGPDITNVIFTPLNSSMLQDGLVFNSTYTKEIEFMQLNFSAFDSDGDLDGDITLYFTANGSSSCALGNRQTGTCYNLSDDSWIVFENGTTTSTFKDEGAIGDFIECNFTATNSSWREYSCLIDEHYNPNVMKWYGAEYNFSDVKYQNATSQRITSNNYLRVEMQGGFVPSDADLYKLDFRVETSTILPTQPLEAYRCNSTYVSGEPEGNPLCSHIASLLPSEFQDDGTKFRALFTKALIDELPNGKYIVLKTDQTASSRWYAIKTYGILNGSHTQKWEYSTTAGGSWTNLADGYETEMNINWFYDGADPTAFIFKVGATDDDAITSNSSIYNMTWVIDPNQNYPPIVDITFPLDEAVISDETFINWSIEEPNDDTTITNITISNSTNTTLLETNLINTTNFTTWNTSGWGSGNYNITAITCENETTELFCANSTHLVTVANVAGLTIDLLSPVNATNQSSTTPTLTWQVSEGFLSDITNVSIWIDGALTETNTSGINGSYSYQDTLLDGDWHTWSVSSYDNNSLQYNSSETWYYAYWNNITIIDVTLLTPIDGGGFSIPQNFVSNVTSNLNIINASWYSNSTGVWKLNQTMDVGSADIESHGIPLIITHSVTIPGGASIEIGDTNLILDNITIASTTIGEDGCILYDENNNTLENSTNLSGNTCFFSGDTILVANTNYSIEVYSGASYTRSYQSIPSVPIAGTKIKFWGGSVNHEVTPLIMQNIDSISFREFGTSGELPFRKSLNDVVLWNVEYCVSTGECNFSSSNFTAILDIIPPSLNVTYPTGNFSYGVVGDPEILEWEVSDNSELDPICIYSYGGTNYTVACALTQTTFNVLDINQEIIMYANDTANNLVSNSTTWNYTILENSVTYDNQTTSGSIEEFKINLTYSDYFSGISVDLNYNGTNYSMTSTDTGYNMEFSETIIIPQVATETNIPFSYIITLSDGVDLTVLESESFNQTVSPLNVDNCSSYSNVLLDMVMIDEDSLLRIDGTIEIELNIYSFETDNLITSYNNSFNHLSTNSSQVCIENLTNQYSMDYQIRHYGNETTYFKKYRNIQQAEISNSTEQQNITLYNLLSSRGHPFNIIIVGNLLHEVGNSGLLIDTQRQYLHLATFETVESPVTDSSGVAIAKLIENEEIYNFIISYNNDLLGTFNNYKVKCANPSLEQCSITLNLGSATGTTPDFEDYGNITQLFSLDTITNTLHHTFVATDGNSKTVRSLVLKDSGYGNETICDNSVYGTSGTLLCVLPAQYQNISIFAQTFVNGELIGSKYFSQGPDIDWSGADILIMLLMFSCLVLLFIGHPMTIIIGAILGMILPVVLVSVAGATFGSIIGATLYYVAGGIIALIVMGRKKI